MRQIEDIDIIKKLRFYGIWPTVKRIFPLAKRYLRLFILNTSSPLGEDLVLSRFFPRKYIGFYVDVGTNDPVLLNNTHYFHKRGWRGINIEPDLQCFKKIEKCRPKDINLNIGIGESSGQLNYNIFFPSLVSTFSEEEKERNIDRGYKFIETKKVDIKRLENVLDKYLPPETRIGIISIDIEGYDLEVLNSMNIAKFKPKLVCIECNRKSISSKIADIMKKNDYSEVYSNSTNSIFKHSG